jgi:hypothetical protein
MAQQPKKSETIRARVPHADYLSWLRMCQRQGKSSSEALRAAMMKYLRRERLTSDIRHSDENSV